MPEYKIKKSKIDDHVEKIGIDVRPTLEPKMEQQHLFNFYGQLQEKFSNLFESVVQSPTNFEVQKKLVFPGKGETTVNTLSMTNRGLVFAIPRKISVFDEETDFDSAEKIILPALRIFSKNFPHKKIIRVGQINEYVFKMGQNSSVQFISNKYTHIPVPDDGEISLRINRPNEEFNRIINIIAVRKKQGSPQLPQLGKQSETIWGIRVVVDFNNRDTSSVLNEDRIKEIIDSSRNFNNETLYSFLNNPSGV